MQINFLDKLDAFLKKEIGDEWNYTFTAEENSLQIQMNVWLEPNNKLLKPTEKVINKELQDARKKT